MAVAGLSRGFCCPSPSAGLGAIFIPAGDKPSSAVLKARARPWRGHPSRSRGASRLRIRAPSGSSRACLVRTACTARAMAEHRGQWQRLRRPGDRHHIFARVFLHSRRQRGPSPSRFSLTRTPSLPPYAIAPQTRPLAGLATVRVKQHRRRRIYPILANRLRATVSRGMDDRWVRWEECRLVVFDPNKIHSF
jgi:hypothetical protein